MAVPIRKGGGGYKGRDIKGKKLFWNFYFSDGEVPTVI